MEGRAALFTHSREWRMIPTGRRRERGVYIYQLEIHPDYPDHLDNYSEADVQQAASYILREGAPSHRLYVMPNEHKSEFYYVIGWKKIYEAYLQLGISDFIPALCYLEPDANEKLWKNWENCPGEISDIK